MRQQIIEYAEAYCEAHGVMPPVIHVVHQLGTTRQTVRNAYLHQVDAGRWIRRGISLETCTNDTRPAESEARADKETMTIERVVQHLREIKGNPEFLAHLLETTYFQTEDVAEAWNDALDQLHEQMCRDDDEASLEHHPGFARWE